MTQTMHKPFIRIILLTAVLYTLLFPHKTTYYCSLSLSMCAKTLIPSIFIFLVLSRLISHYASDGMFSGKFTRLAANFLNLPECLIPTCIIGLFCGAPSGAFAISKIYENGQCTKKQAQNAAALANNCSSAFIMSVAGAMTGSVKYALLILVSSILSAITIYMIFFREKEAVSSFSDGIEPKKTIFSEALTESICSSAEAAVGICGYVLFFSSAGLMLSDTVSDVLPEMLGNNTVRLLKGVICSLFEMTSGVVALGAADGYEKILLIASAVAFCGISVIFQVKSILGKSGLSSSSFVISKILSAITTPILTLLFLFLIPQSISVSATAAKQTGGFSFGDLICLTVIVCLFLVGAGIFSHLDKKHKK